jgi:alpha-D-ribose 1-methylphosphonate 5-triphosphate synthase subunit PhnG
MHEARLTNRTDAPATAHLDPASPSGMTRSERMSALALAADQELERLWEELPVQRRFEWIRPPEFCAVMVRGRVGGDGRSFNLGEAAVTRCVLQLADSDTIGVACVVGRRRRHATFAALLDAVSQIDGRCGDVARKGILTIREARTRRQEELRASLSSTEVDFSMLLRTEQK